MAEAGIGLIERWRALVGASAAGDAAFADLAARYGEAHRRYHTLEHIGEVLDAADRLGASDAVLLAAWFHDAIYDPRVEGNEAASARLARDVLSGLGVDGKTVGEVARLVELTAGHAVDAGDHSGAVLADADLTILGASPSRYDRYAADVRVEYGWLADDVWRTGRSRVLGGFLARDSIYLVDVDREAPARLNLERELAVLSGAAEPGRP